MFNFPHHVELALSDLLGLTDKQKLIWLARSAFQLAEMFHEGKQIPLTPEKVLPYTFYFFPKTYTCAFVVLRSVIERYREKEEIHVIDFAAGSLSASCAFLDVLFVEGKEKVKTKKIKFTVQDISDMSLKVGIKILEKIAQHYPVEIEIEKKVSDTLREKVSPDTDLAIISFSLYDVFGDDTAEMTAWLERNTKKLKADALFVVVEPAVKKRNAKFLMEVRDNLRKFVQAPCTHTNDCPIRKRQDDWCHFGLKWRPPSWFERAVFMIGGSIPEINFSYLVLSKNPKRYEGFARVVSRRLDEKGRIRFWTCESEGKILYQVLKRDITEKNKMASKILQGDVVKIEGWEERDGFRKITPETKVEIQDFLLF